MRRLFLIPRLALPALIKDSPFVWYCIRKAISLHVKILFVFNVFNKF